MIACVTVVRLHNLPHDLDDLVAESQRDGFLFLRRFADDWQNNANRFSKPGEALFGAVVGERVIGVCGLNVDPFVAEGRVGRMRHLYVSAEFRRRGVGTRLIAAIVEAARGKFDRLRLRTDSDSASQFYEAIGFHRCVAEPACTHAMESAN